MVELLTSARNPRVVFEAAVPAVLFGSGGGNSLASSITTAVNSRRVFCMGFRTLAVASLWATTAFAQNIAGTWQGTLQAPQRQMRLVMKITRAGDESLK